MPREEIVKKAADLAQVIQAEMAFPVPLRDGEQARLVGKLLDEVPERGQVSFQQQGGEVTPKGQLGEDLAIEEHMLKLFFCLFHDEFVLDAGTDVDHVFAFNKIRQKQSALLEFLNTDKEFANIFLDQPGMNEYFRRDKNGQVKGTGYFFKLCYNDIGNLLLMCHACNIRKSVPSPLEWFREQEIYFGEKFVEKVTEAGGLHEGIILPKIYRPDARDATIMILETNICLHIGDSIGLGAFALQWFFDHFKGVYDAHADFYQYNYVQFKKALDEMRLLIVEGDAKGASERHRVLRKMLTGYEAVYGAFAEVEKKRESDTDSDGSGDARIRKQDVAMMLGEGDLITHETKKIKKLLREYYQKKIVEALGEKCQQLKKEGIILSQQWREIFEELKGYLDNKSSSGPLPTEEAMKDVLTELYRNKAEALIKAKEEIGRQTRRAEEEGRMRAEAERRVEEAERRNAELMARLAQFERDGDQGSVFVRSAERKGEDRKRIAEEEAEKAAVENKKARRAGMSSPRG